MWDLIVSVPDHCLSFYFELTSNIDFTPGISRCRSQHVSVESSSLLHHSIYL